MQSRHRPPSGGHAAAPAPGVGGQAQGTRLGMVAVTDVPTTARAGEAPASGLVHTGAALVSVLTGVPLVVVAASVGGWRAGLPTAIYAVTILGLFGVSASYHRRAWGPVGHTVMKRLDHAMIFVFIAGTYTPIAVLALPHPKSTLVLQIVWAGAAAGAGLKLLWPGAPRWVGVPLYLALGWVAVFVLPDLQHGGGTAVLILIALGGLAYTVGGLVYAFQRPNPYPTTFGFHELFHACTILAAANHYAAICLLIH